VSRVGGEKDLIARGGGNCGGLAEGGPYYLKQTTKWWERGSGYTKYRGKFQKGVRNKGVNRRTSAPKSKKRGLDRPI